MYPIPLGEIGQLTVFLPGAENPQLGAVGEAL